MASALRDEQSTDSEAEEVAELALWNNHQP